MNSRNQTAAAISSGDKPTGTATILGIGTANPNHIVKHSIFPEYYFDLVNNDNMPDLKEKFRRICEKSKIEKRYIALLREDIKSHPSIGFFAAPSQDVRQELLESRLSLMALEACKNAIKDWGRPVTEITHIIFVNNGGSVLPGPDYELVNLLGLPISTNRFMLYQQGCVGGGTAMRMAKDIVENNRGARVLAVSCEMTSITGFRGPSESHFENLLSQALFGDGSGAIVVGADLLPDERPIFEIVSATQSFIPSSQDAIVLRITDSGFLSTLKPTVAPLIAGGILKLATQALEPLGILDRESVFWVVHPGGAAILDMVQKKLGLKDEKFEATREVLRECGNMSSASIFFVMDAMRKRSADRGQSTPGEGLEWGVLFAFGPGLTVETAVLRCPSARV